jgi:hypothetical protein
MSAILALILVSGFLTGNAPEMSNLAQSLTVEEQYTENGGNLIRLDYAPDGEWEILDVSTDGEQLFVDWKFVPYVSRVYILDHTPRASVYVWREVFGVVDGELRFIERIDGEWIRARAATYRISEAEEDHLEVGEFSLDSVPGLVHGPQVRFPREVNEGFLYNPWGE